MAPKIRTSIKKAEEAAYAGENESQDSQVVVERYHREHGVGMLSSSPAPDDLLQVAASARGQAAAATLADTKADSGRLITDTAELTRSPHDALESKTRTATALPFAAKARKPSQGQFGHAEVRCSLRGQPNTAIANQSAPTQKYADTAAAATPLLKDDALPQLPRPTVLPKWNKKMDDLMSESPTQSNNDRSYEQYRGHYEHVLPSSSQQTNELGNARSGVVAGDSQVSRGSSSHEHRTLHEDETGAVKFDWRPHENDAHDADVEDDKDSPDPLYTTSQPTGKSQPSVSASLDRHSMPASTMPPPETPIVAQRPFQQDISASNLIRPSQLFEQTQFTSGVKKLASPTSSRPSPHIFQHNTISPNNISSPLKDRGLRSSPTQGAATSPPYSAPATSKLRERQDSEPALEIIPGSPNVAETRVRNRPEPIGDYAPIRNSPSSEIEDQREVDVQTDSDSDESQERRRLVKLKQEKANRSLTNISFPRQGSKEKVEVPSTNRRKKRTSMQSSTSAVPSSVVIGHHLSSGAEDPNDSQETVADSQELAVNHVTTKQVAELVVLDAISDEITAPTQSEFPAGPQRSNETTGSKETIPETSPARDRSRPRNTHSGPLNPTRLKALRSSGEKESSRPSSEETGALPSSPPIPVIVAESSQGPRRSMRARPVVTPIPSSLTNPATEQAPATTSSTLTVLTETPRMSSSTTPNTDAASRETADKVDSSPPVRKSLVSSPAAAKNLRLKPPKLKTYSSPASRRHASISTDELAPSTPASATMSRTSRSFARKSITEVKPPSSNGGLFQGMTFATSFQSEQEKKRIEQIIVGAGGSILTNGFGDLIEVGPLESHAILSLRDGHNTGFAALITDTHSRKVKYMQALALGLPCLSWRWISHCVRVNAIVDWNTYLLCAGESSILKTVRSRSLEIYNASDTNLEQTIDKRLRLLNDTKILFVMKKSKKEEDKRMQYVFLAQVLGASLVRVNNLEDARKELQKKEHGNQPFDWVYVDGQSVGAEQVLFGQSQTVTKKRKRQSTTESLDDPPPKRVRTMTDELMIQSLILGRLVEDGEFEDDTL